jgi:O-acetyl-ADP-ribose deacetylase (regulator of RNase III)
MVSMMITYTEGNLLDADVEAVVNTVNTVGVMGKGIALMFKEAFPENFKAYDQACKRKEVRLGRMFVFKREDLYGPKWIVNFPTKGHWRYPSKIEWIEDGLADLKAFIKNEKVASIAIPPLGSGNGKLDWKDVKSRISATLRDLTDVNIIVYEPTSKYQNVAKRAGVEKLTPARALVAELVRRYSVLGIECTLLEVQKLAYFLERNVVALGLPNKFNFRFSPNKFGPYSDKLKHMLNGLDGSYLHCDKRLSDAGPFDVIHFDEAKRNYVAAYLTTPDAKRYVSALDATSELIDGFESPFGMELLATVDWMIANKLAELNTQSLRSALTVWPGGEGSGERKAELFDDRVIDIAVDTLKSAKALCSTAAIAGGEAVEQPKG